jgi:exonuclease VII large subunit
MVEHRSAYRKWLADNSSTYYTSFEILQHGDAYIELLEACPSESHEELHRREGELIREHDCVNKVIPGRTSQEYYRDNTERLKQYRLDNAEHTKQYYQDNAEHLKQYGKQYRQDNAERIKQRNKQNYRDNVELLKQRMKKYQRDNVERIKQLKCKKIMCSYCDYTLNYGNKSRHIKSTNHINNYKASWLECFGEPFEGPIPMEDY